MPELTEVVDRLERGESPDEIEKSMPPDALGDSGAMGGMGGGLGGGFDDDY